MREAAKAITDRAGTIRERYRRYSPSGFTNTILELVDLVDELADMAAGEWSPGRTSGPERDGSPSRDS